MSYPISSHEPCARTTAEECLRCEFEECLHLCLSIRYSILTFRILCCVSSAKKSGKMNSQRKNKKNAETLVEKVHEDLPAGKVCHHFEAMHG
jgi:hypothetical protein